MPILAFMYENMEWELKGTLSPIEDEKQCVYLVCSTEVTICLLKGRWLKWEHWKNSEFIAQHHNTQ